jgi:type I restriction enzyme, S subunit
MVSASSRSTEIRTDVNTMTHSADSGIPVPHDWRACELGEAITLQRGFDLPLRLRRPGNIPIISSSGLNGWHDEYKVSAPGIVTGRYGTIGEVFLVEKDFWPLNTTLYVKEFNGTYALYVYYLLKTVDFDSHSGKSGVPGVNRNDVHQERILLPPINEQTAIANALSDVDALISSLENLIAKKQAIKTATMQQLLTGRTRLPQFARWPDGTLKGAKQTELGEVPEDWECVSLAELAEIKSGGTPSTSNPEYWGGDVHWCTPTDITALKGEKYISSTERCISQMGLSSSAADLLPRGSIVMTSRATIGECAIVKVPLSTNQGFKNFVCKGHVHNEYLYYLLTTQKSGFVSLCSGSTFLEISASQVRSYKVCIPGLPEQQAIASVISDIDSELQRLKGQSSKTRQIKQGMMQELLTGRTRLATPEQPGAIA